MRIRSESESQPKPQERTVTTFRLTSGRQAVFVGAARKALVRFGTWITPPPHDSPQRWNDDGSKRSSDVPVFRCMPSGVSEYGRGNPTEKLPWPIAVGSNAVPGCAVCAEFVIQQTEAIRTLHRALELLEHGEGRAFEQAADLVIRAVAKIQTHDMELPKKLPRYVLALRDALCCVACARRVASGEAVDEPTKRRAAIAEKAFDELTERYTDENADELFVAVDRVASCADIGEKT